MKLLIIRHADPDYSIDSLTEKGRREAELLADRLCRMEIAAFYVSPLGRAQDTASYTLKRMGRKAETLDWLREFSYPVKLPYLDAPHLSWDFLPGFYSEIEELYDPVKWEKVAFMQEAEIGTYYRHVTNGLDHLLESHGYKRDGKIYDVLSANRDTIVFFCHFGLECYLLSHLLHISPVALTHGFAAAPSSVTTLNTEEREKGKAIFRCASFGDISHLYCVGEAPSFSARYCETFSCEGERH